MRIGNVIGKITLSICDPAYLGGRWLVVSPLDARQYAVRNSEERVSEIPSLIVYDNLGAREGDLVGFVEGAEATAPFDHPIAIDAYNTAILDRFDYRPPMERAQVPA